VKRQEIYSSLAAIMLPQLYP